MEAKLIAEEIRSGKAILGIELGSTRIKSVLIDTKNVPVAQGAFDWENSFIDGIWTYPLDKVYEGIAESYARMKEDVMQKYGVELTKLRALGTTRDDDTCRHVAHAHSRACRVDPLATRT